MLPLRPLFDARLELAEVVSLGPTPTGRAAGHQHHRRHLQGRPSPRARADWQLVRADCVADLDARYTLETDTGALIQVQSRGLRHGPTEILARLAAGEAFDPASYYFRTVPRFETSASELDWLNRVIAVAHGARLPRAVQLNAFELL
jgi:hypothetical protein